jgi:hypothetical protein
LAALKSCQPTSPNIWQQVQTTTAMPQAGVQLVAVVEPGVSIAALPSVLWRHGLVGGLIEADDLDVLGTLDVPLLGINAMSAPMRHQPGCSRRHGSAQRILDRKGRG